MNARKKIPNNTQTQVLGTSRRRCCICFHLHGDVGVKQGQIAHLDRKRANHGRDNLAFLCLKHHDEYDTRRSQSKGFTEDEVKQYRQRLIEVLADESIGSPLLSGAAFSDPTSHRSKQAEIELKRNLKLRDNMRRDFIKPPEEIKKLRPFYHPYDLFEYSEAIIHSLNDISYPEARNEPGTKISGWFKVELYEFYHNGLAVIVNLVRGVVGAENRWAPIPHDATIDTNTYREIQLWVLGRIPWRNIRHYDLAGDNYYSGPHIYCDFADGGTPYEGFAYSMLGDRYDYPLENDKRLKTQAWLSRPE